MLDTPQNGVAVITGTLRNNSQSSTLVYTIANGGQINLNPAPEPSGSLILSIGALILTGRFFSVRLHRVKTGSSRQVYKGGRELRCRSFRV